MNIDNIQLTISICTYNRGNILLECLNSLLKQTISSDNYIVLIIDNNSTDNTKYVLESIKYKFNNFYYIVEKNQGLSYARNRALEETKTPWMASIDSDAKAHPKWIETIFEVIKNNDFDCFGGPYYAWHLYGPQPIWLPKNFGTYEASQSYGLLKGKTYIPGGNYVVRCDVAREIGRFSTELGMKGNQCGYGEETNFFEKMHQAGYRMGYVPNLIIYHCVLPHKYSIKWQFESAFARGKSNAYLDKYLKKSLSYKYLRVTKNITFPFIRFIKEIISNKHSDPIIRLAFKNICSLFFAFGLIYGYFYKRN